MGESYFIPLQKTVWKNKSGYTAVTAISIIPLPKVYMKIFYADS